MSGVFDNRKASIHTHLLNNIDTGSSFTELDEIVKATNTYLALPKPKLPLLEAIQKYVEKFLGLMGLDYSEEGPKTDSREVEFMNVFTRFRDNIRANAKSDFKRIL